MDRLTVLKRKEIPTSVKINNLYLTQGVDDLLVLQLVDKDKTIYHTPLSEGLIPRHTTSGKFLGSGVYTLVNSVGKDVLYIPNATGSLRFVVVNAIATNSNSNIRVVRLDLTDTINGEHKDLITTENGMWLLSDAATGGWVATKLSGKGDTGNSGEQGPKGCNGKIGPQGPQGVAGAVGEQGSTGPIGPPGNSDQEVIQLSEATEFTISHNFGWFPIVTIYKLQDGDYKRAPDNEYELIATANYFTIVSPTPITGICIYS